MREFLTVGGMQRLGLIKSIQRGTISVPAAGGSAGTLTINAVVLRNTILNVLGDQDGGSDITPGQVCVITVFTNTTTISANRTLGATAAASIEVEVIEYYPGVLRNVQHGTYSTTAATSGTATVTAVDVNRSQLFNLGFSCTSGAGAAMGEALIKQKLTDLVTITANATGALTRTVSYCLAEYN